MSWKSHPVRGAWIEIRKGMLPKELRDTSHPVRGAWIEMIRKRAMMNLSHVASRKGCVD